MEIPFFFCTSLRTYDTTSDILRMYSAEKKTIYNVKPCLYVNIAIKVSCIPAYWTKDQVQYTESKMCIVPQYPFSVIYAAEQAQSFCDSAYSCKREMAILGMESGTDADLSIF